MVARRSKAMQARRRMSFMGTNGFAVIVLSVSIEGVSGELVRFSLLVNSEGKQIKLSSKGEPKVLWPAVVNLLRCLDVNSKLRWQGRQLRAQKHPEVVDIIHAN
jgi:hypothetical protein